MKDFGAEFRCAFPLRCSQGDGRRNAAGELSGEVTDPYMSPPADVAMIKEAMRGPYLQCLTIRYRPRRCDPLFTAPPPLPRLPTTGHVRTCQWLEGEPRELNWCGAPVKELGCSWCARHYRIVWEKRARSPRSP
jgi:hypothetical protein